MVSKNRTPTTGPTAIISITSVPQRFDTNLIEVISALQKQHVPYPIIVNIPRTYKKWGEASIPESLAAMGGITLFRPSEDYGPATKLLGALEYLGRDTKIDYIVTMDDDIVCDDKNRLPYLMKFASLLPGCAVTAGGLNLVRQPEGSHAALNYKNRFRFVDIPAGFKNVVYPARPLLDSNLPFSCRHGLPEGMFHDDDIYLGIVLSRLGIPILAVPEMPMRKGSIRYVDTGSVVVHSMAKHRSINSQEMRDHAIERGWFPNNHGAREGLSITQKLRMRSIRLRHSVKLRVIPAKKPK